MEFVVFRTPKGQIKKVFLDGERLHRYGEAFLLETPRIDPDAGVNVCPLGVLFYLCDAVEDETVVVRGTETYFERTDTNKVRVQFEDVNRRQDYDESFGLRFTKEVKREVLRNWKGIQMEEEEGFQDDGESIALFYAKEFTGVNLKRVVEDVFAFEEEINKITRERMIQILQPYPREISQPYLKKKRIRKPLSVGPKDFL